MFWEKLRMVLISRKFWVLILAVLAATATFATGKIDGWQFAQLVIASLAVFSTGMAIEDMGRNISAPDSITAIVTATKTTSTTDGKSNTDVTTETISTLKDPKE